MLVKLTPRNHFLLVPGVVIVRLSADCSLYKFGQLSVGGLSFGRKKVIEYLSKYISKYFRKIVIDSHYNYLLKNGIKYIKKYQKSNE
jgi:hypothetical protein